MTQGLAIPKVGACEFREEERDWGDTLVVLCTYRTRGPRFRHAVADEKLYRLRAIRDLNERRHSMFREAYEGVVAQVEAHRAVTEPWPT